MRLPYRIGQGFNYLGNRLDRKKVRWVYIHGVHRSGTSYMLRQLMQKSKRGCGDWMLKQFVDPYRAVQKRETNRKMNVDRLWRDFRRNLLRSAHVGGGFKYDIVIKQACGSVEEVEFLTDLFGGPPCEIIYMYREPNGWWLSTKKKFDSPDGEMKQLYSEALGRYELLGGIPICYDENLITKVMSYDIFRGIKFEEFNPKPTPDVPEARELVDLFEARKRYFESKVTELSDRYGLKK